MKQRLQWLWKKCWFRIITIFAFCMIALVLLRNPIFRGIGQYLAAADAPQETQACFILGGNSFERGMEGVALHAQFPQLHFYPTGGNYPLQIQALDTVMTEAELTGHLLRKKGVPAELVHPLSIGTSTMEESEGILKYCQEHQLTDITVVSSMLHLRRVRRVFEEKFAAEGIHVHFHGSNAQEFNANNWWTNEEGLIMGQNELVKLLYYAIKY